MLVALFAAEDPGKRKGSCWMGPTCRPWRCSEQGRGQQLPPRAVLDALREAPALSAAGLLTVMLVEAIV